MGRHSRSAPFPCSPILKTQSLLNPTYIPLRPIWQEPPPCRQPALEYRRIDTHRSPRHYNYRCTTTNREVAGQPCPIVSTRCKLVLPSNGINCLPVAMPLKWMRPCRSANWSGVPVGASTQTPVDAGLGYTATASSRGWDCVLETKLGK
jgi:hypothetical protein